MKNYRGISKEIVTHLEAKGYMSSLQAMKKVFADGTCAIIDRRFLLSGARWMRIDVFDQFGRYVYCAFFQFKLN